MNFSNTGHYKHSSISIGGEMVERVTGFKSLVVSVLEDLSWSTNIASGRKNTTAPLLPEETKEGQDFQAADGEFLQVCHIAVF